jgi:hypothetical protein
MTREPFFALVGTRPTMRACVPDRSCGLGTYPPPDIAKTDFSPASGAGRQPLEARRRLFKVGNNSNLLADLEVTPKTVERVAESIGADLEAGNNKALSPDHRQPADLYIQMEGTQRLVVKSETEGRTGRIPGHTSSYPRVQTGHCVYPSEGKQHAGRRCL